ncbi:MAG: hypothetical protein HKN56_09745 [Gammaproteobacteria bacterium]|nr:hypothetical protein [Gammaproteobacteria bacterium]
MACGTALAGLLLLPAAALEHRHQNVPKQVALLIEPGRLLASNVRLSRIDVLALEEGERLVRQIEADAALAAVTSWRIVAYGPAVGWRELPLLPDEQVEEMRAEDYAVFVTTDRRYLNFSAKTGLWAERLRTSS